MKVRYKCKTDFLAPTDLDELITAGEGGRILVDERHHRKSSADDTVEKEARKDGRLGHTEGMSGHDLEHDHTCDTHIEHSYSKDDTTRQRQRP